MPGTTISKADTAATFASVLSLSAEKGLALLVSGAVAWSEELQTAVYFHEKATGMEKRMRFVVCPWGANKPLFSFLGSEEQVLTLAGQKYAAWRKRQEKRQH